MSDHDDEFKVMHKILYDMIDNWAANPAPHQHPKWMQWTKWVFAGLHAIMPIPRLKTVLDVHTMFDYVNKVLTFPPIQENFTFDIASDSVKYSHLPHYRLAPDHGFMDFMHLTEKFHNKTQELTKLLVEVEMKAEVCATTQKHHFANLHHNTQQLTAGIVNTSIASLKQSIEDIVSKKITAFEQTLDQKIDDIIQDVYASSENGHNAMIQAHENMLLDVEEQLQQKHLNFQQQIQDLLPTQTVESAQTISPYRPAAWFNHSNIDHNFKQSTNPFDTHSVPDHNLCRSPTFGNYNGNNFRRSPIMINPTKQMPSQAQQHSVPTMVSIDMPRENGHTMDQLPPVNHDYAIKRTRI